MNSWGYAGVKAELCPNAKKQRQEKINVRPINYFHRFVIQQRDMSQKPPFTHDHIETLLQACIAAGISIDRYVLDLILRLHDAVREFGPDIHLRQLAKIQADVMEDHPRSLERRIKMEVYCDLLTTASLYSDMSTRTLLFRRILEQVQEGSKDIPLEDRAKAIMDMHLKESDTPDSYS